MTCREDVENYRKMAQRESAIERQSTEKEKTGVFIGAFAINPVNRRRIPIWIADYVMMGYGTGAIMAVPAHDERDFEFALKFGIPIIPVIERNDGIAKSRVFEDICRAGFRRGTRAGRHSLRVPRGLLLDHPARRQAGRSIHSDRQGLPEKCRGVDRDRRQRVGVHLRQSGRDSVRFA